MATWQCAECTAVYSVGAPACPQCRSTIRVNEATQQPEEGDDMAKITVHGGPSNEAADAVAPVSEETEDTTEAETKPATRSAKRSRPARAADSTEE